MRLMPVFAAAALLAGCTTASTPVGKVYFVRDGMVGAIDPSANAIWNLQVEVMDDYGNFDPALMDDAKWAALEDAARTLEREGSKLEAADTFIVANPAGTLPPVPAGTDLAAIQARLTTNEAGYRGFTHALAQHAGKLVEAAKARDAAAATALANDMQPICKACHDVFWYPEQL